MEVNNVVFALIYDLLEISDDILILEVDSLRGVEVENDTSLLAHDLFEFLYDKLVLKLDSLLEFSDIFALELD